MPRTVPEWIGKTDDTPVPPRVQVRVFDAHNGRCHVTGRKIWPTDKYEIDHVIALCNGGENRESNLAPILVDAHKKKTKADRDEKKRIDRIRKKHLGLHQSGGRPMAGNRNSPWKAKIGGGWERRS